MAAFLALLLWPLLQQAAAAPWTERNSRWNINFETQWNPLKYYGEWEGHRYNPSPPDWRALSIYQLLTDRFVDGDPRNNEKFEGDFDVRDMSFRHGGDFEGIRQKLPYIKGLGCKAIWISPIFENGPNSYHQYAQRDFTLLDPRLGTLEELRRLTSEAHELGLYIIIDIVMNHMANEFAFEGHVSGSAPFAFHETEEYKLVLRSNKSLLSTPAGAQPYSDFWYNNTWDPQGSYGGPVYGKWGESQTDTGSGTYTWSDFHHNGDLVDFSSPFQITLGKIYGTMDDLRLESRRVQEKYIAMTKALISSADIDGFRVDTPMQVPLEFFKAWVPAIQEHAKTLGKDRFGIFGEFFVSTERYATMTGRGKTPAMYGHEAFIDGPSTLKGGIDYTYYWYLFTSLVSKSSEYTDGLALAYEAENQMLDLVEPSTNQPEFAMWTFCNNHDNWRLQVAAGFSEMRLCTTLITFWPGTPLHYAGDEQDFNTPGSALDGWAREELATSLAWRSLPTTPAGNPASGDNFDMTSPSYRFVRRLNLLRQAYFGEFGSPACDVLDTPSAGSPDVLVFSRACTEENRIAFMANFHSEEVRNVSFTSRWPAGTVLQDILSQEGSQFQIVVGEGGTIPLALGPLQVRIFAAGAKKLLPAEVTAVIPMHGDKFTAEALHNGLKVTVRFDRPMQEESARSAIKIDGRAPSPDSVSCLAIGDEEGTCSEIHIQHSSSDISSGGFHSIEVAEGVEATDGTKTLAAFRSIFLVEKALGPISDPGMREQPGLICNYLTQLCHEAPGAKWMRIKHLGDSWGPWREYEPVTEWQAQPGRTVLVQYHAEGSASYIVADCVLHREERCHASWHGEMFLRTDANEWGMKAEGRMKLVDHFTWAVNMSFSEYVNAKFAPYPNWDKSYGKQKAREMRYQLPTFDERSREFMSKPLYDGTEAIREHMVSRGMWEGDQSIVSGAESAAPFWLSHLCNQKPPYPAGMSVLDWQCHPYQGDQDNEWCRNVGEDEDYLYMFNKHTKYMGDCGTCDCCRKVKPPEVSAEKHTCCILFNDLFLNYSVTSDLSRCEAQEVRPAPSGPVSGSLMSADIMALFWCIVPFAVALVGVLRKKNQNVVRMHFSSDQQAKPSTASSIWKRSRSSTASSESTLAVTGTRSATSDSTDSSFSEVEIMRPDRVLFASLEHVIEYEGGREKAIAGGLGKVAGLMCRYHPGPLICVTACMPGKDYSFAERVGQIRARVSGRDLKVAVLRYEFVKPEEPDDDEGESGDGSGGPPTVTYYLVDHPIFREREDIYPAPQTARRTLEFYSLWCQSIARIIDLEAPDLFHCPDFHGAMAVMYIERPLPVVLVMHNAEYQGAISTQHMGRREARYLADVFDLPDSRIRQETFIEGKFCMLKPIIDYARKFQNGYGIAAVSSNYALEASLKHAVLWNLPEVRGIENCMPETERMASAELSGAEELAKARAAAKLFVQKKYGLKEDPDARIFVFLGRWVKQKGVDYIADVAGWMLSTFQNAQLIMIGPVGDCFGSYAKAKLEAVMDSGRFKESLFVHADFLIVPQELKLACDFCLMPSRDEPFGYVDIEFAWFGASIVGSLRGGLGKLPGFYFQILNADSPSHMQEALRNAIAEAMSCPAEVLAEMAVRARASSFPVAGWQRDMLQAYELVLLKFFTKASLDAMPPVNPRSISDAGSETSSVHAIDDEADGDCGAANEVPKGSEFLRQEATEREMQQLVEAKFASVAFPNACALIERVEWERELSQERSCFSRGLGKVVFGAPIMDWVISLCYMSGPLIPALTLANAGAADGEAFAVLRPVAQAVALIVWTASACAVSPNRLMALALLARCLPLALPFFEHSAPVAAAILGMVGASDYLFLYYSFMGSSVGDVAALAMRTGLIMAVREQWEPLLQILEGIPQHTQLSLTALVGFFFILLPTLLLLQAPLLYRVFCIPEISYSWVRKLRFLKLFAAASVFEAFSKSSSTALLRLRTMEPFELSWVTGYLWLLAFISAATMVLFAILLKRFPTYAVVLVKAFACCTLPASILQCWAEVEIDRNYMLTPGLDALIFLSTMVGALALYAGAVAVLATIGSRWRFVSYACAVGFCTSLARAASFYVLAFATGETDVIHEATGLPKRLASRLLLVVLPASITALLLRIVAFFFFEREATGMLRTWRNKSLTKLAISRQGEMRQLVAKEDKLGSSAAATSKGSAFGRLFR